MRDSQYKSCAVQNQFTAYLIAAIRNYKRTYLRRISTALRTELPMEGHSEVMELCEETDFFCGLPLMQRLENERLFAAIQIRRDHRDVAERSIVFLKAEAADELRKVGVITAVEHSIIRAAPIQLNDIVDLRPQLALGKFPRAHAADFFLFTKKNVATELTHQQ